MRSIIQVLLLFILLTNIRVTSAQDEISWSPDYNLKWADFKGDTSFAQHYVENAVTKIRIEATTAIYKKHYSFSVPCIFEKNNSWTVEHTSVSLLMHEQLHFDIGEVFARELRKKLAEMDHLTDLTIKERVKTLYHEVNNACIAYEKKYDIETNHGKSPEKQAIWQIRINAILQSTAKHQSITFTVSK